ncbi:hypothetical protein Tco_0000765 [Tanacetum coccineum]
MSSYTHPSIPSDYVVEDAFSSTNAPNYIPTPPGYSLVTPGNISPDSSDDLTKDFLSSLSISPFHDDPYMKEISPPKDTETPVESSILVSPSLSVISSSLVRSTTRPPDYRLIIYLSGRGMKPLGSELVPEEPNESNAC